MIAYRTTTISREAAPQPTAGLFAKGEGVARREARPVEAAGLTLAPSSAPTVLAIQLAVARASRVRFDLLVAPDGPAGSRAFEVSHPRQLAMLLCRRLIEVGDPDARAPLSFFAIGQRFGGRNHATVRHACIVAEKRLAADPKLRAVADAVMREMGVEHG